MSSKTKFIHFKCRNTQKLDRVAQKAQKMTSVKIEELGFMRLLLRLIKSPLSVYKFNGKKGAFYYCRNNFYKTVIRMPKFYSLPPVKALYKGILSFKSRLMFAEIEHVFQTQSFEGVMIWGGSYLPQTILKELCKKYDKKTLFFEVASLPGKIQVDPKGVNFLSSLSREPEFYHELTFKNTEVMPDEIGFRASKKKDQKSLKTLPQNYIFVPFQVPSDSQILDFSPWVESMVHLYEVLDEVSQSLPDTVFVIKEHPSFKLSVRDHVRANERIVFANANDTKELIESSDAVLTINSSVGLEALILSKKVIVLGNVNYDIEGLVQKAESPEELVKVIKNLEDWEIQEDLRVQYLKFFYNRYLISGDYDDLSEATVRASLKKANLNL